MKVEGSKELTQALMSMIPANVENKDIVFFCIGTDRSTGDSLGPLVGSKLKKKRYKVIGTIDDPTHATNLEERIPKGKFIIAIDACLGSVASTGKHIIESGPLKPGAGVGKEISPVGDMSISSVVNVGGFMEYMVLQNTRLSLVMRLADEIAIAIHNVMHIRKLASREVATTK